MNTALVLDPAVIKQLRRECVGAEFPAGATVCSPGDPPQFYVVLSGEITLRLVGSDGLSYEERRAGAGATFGETSILGSGREPAEAVASCPSTLLAFTPAWFWGAMEELPALRAHVLHSLANESRSARLAAWELYRKGQVGQRIAKSSSQSGPLVARSGAMKEVQKELAELFRQFVPVLITGERGTGKTFVATKLFESSFDDESPFVVIDCRSLEGGSAPSILFGDRQFQRAPDPSSGYGAVHVAHRGALLLRHVDCLPSSCQPALADYLNACGDSGEDFFPRTRVLATSRQNLLALAEDGRFDSRLAGVLLRNSLKLPNMENRRRDIPDLITQFLRERNDGSSLGKDAAAFLYSRDYPAYHAGELKGIVNFAAVMARGEPIRAQHVVGEHRVRIIDIDPARGSTVVRWLTLGPGLMVLRAVAASSLAAVILTALLASSGAVRQTANSSIWELWQPMLILSFLFLGRLWCAVCPLATLGLALQDRLGLHLKVPRFVKEYGPYLAGAGFLLLCLIEHAFEMRANAGTTCVLLLTLVGLATLFSLVFERHAWCQHLCPMGALGGTFSNLSSLLVSANPWYCVNRCTSPHCLNGREGSEGCPTFRHPNQMSTQSQCKFCMSCLKLCPHQAVSLQLNVPLTRLWNSASLDNRLTSPLLSLYALSVLMMAADEIPFARTGAGLVLMVASSLGLAAGLTWGLTHGFRTETGVDSSFPARIGGALLVLSWGTLVADQLQHLSWLDAVRISVATRTSLGDFLSASASPGVGVVSTLQIAALLLGAVLCFYTLRKARLRLKTLGGEVPRRKWIAVHTLVALQLGASVALSLSRC